MESASLTDVLLDDEPRRARAKERLYVVCQLIGWGAFLALQVIFSRLFPYGEKQHDEVRLAATCVGIVLKGLLLTHFARYFMTRWGWKQLGWRALMPRVLAMALVLSIIWCASGFLYTYGLLGEPLPAKYSLPVLFVLSCFDGWIVMTAWLCVYFFYHLFDRFNRLEIERLRLATTVKESELRALKSQVNPHFIFNSLNSLRALIEEDPLRARQAVTQLANLLRYSLQSGQQETVPFEDELSVVNDYLALEQVRHEERLRLRLDVAPDTLQLPIPPMLLQTLVENAVKYGISARPEGGEIAIIARRENDSLRLQVTNPGAYEPGAAKLARANGSTGVGLANAANRLRLLFGEQATLQLRAGSPGSVVAEAIIPLPVSHA